MVHLVLCFLITLASISDSPRDWIEVFDMLVKRPRQQVAWTWTMELSQADGIPISGAVRWCLEEISFTEWSREYKN